MVLLQTARGWDPTARGGDENQSTEAMMPWGVLEGSSKESEVRWFILVVTKLWVI